MQLKTPHHWTSSQQPQLALQRPLSTLIKWLKVPWCLAADARRSHLTAGGVFCNWRLFDTGLRVHTLSGITETTADSKKVVAMHACGSVQMQGVPTPQRNVYDAKPADHQSSTFWNCESGCAYNGITNFVTNLLMKVQHVTVSENSVHKSLCIIDGGLDLEFRTLSRQT